MNTVAVGIYAFYSRLAEMATNILPIRLFDNIIQPMFFAVKPAEADARLPLYFTFLLNMNLLVQWPIVAFAAAYHREIVWLGFGGKFIERSWLLPLILGFATINCFATPVSLVAQYEEKPHIQLLSKVFAAYNVLAMLILIPKLGLYGAALASGTAQVLKNAFVWWHVRRRAVWLNAGESIACSIAIWSATIAVCCGLKRIIALPPLIQLLMGTIIFGCVGLLYIRSPVLCPSDRELLKNLFPGKETRMLRLLGFLHVVPNAPTVGRMN
jgi:O-antigen/teichoic acid export membrane protein